MDDAEIYAKDPCALRSCATFGAFVTESSRHMSEYVPYFRRTPELIAALTSCLPTSNATGANWLNAGVMRQYEKMVEDTPKARPVTLERSHEYCRAILDAIESNAPYRFNGNVRNKA